MVYVLWLYYLSNGILASDDLEKNVLLYFDFIFMHAKM